MDDSYQFLKLSRCFRCYLVEGVTYCSVNNLNLILLILTKRCVSDKRVDNVLK